MSHKERKSRRESNKELKSRILQLEKLLQEEKAKSKAEREKIRQEFFESLALEKDYLQRIEEAIYLYSQRGSDEKHFTKAAIDFINIVTELLGIEKINEIGDEIQFQPEIHRSDEKIKIGSSVIVVRTGWKLKGTNIYVAPVVKPKK